MNEGAVDEWTHGWRKVGGRQASLLVFGTNDSAGLCCAHCKEGGRTGVGRAEPGLWDGFGVVHPRRPQDCPRLGKVDFLSHFPRLPHPAPIGAVEVILDGTVLMLCRVPLQWGMGQNVGGHQLAPVWSGMRR